VDAALSWPHWAFLYMSPVITLPLTLSYFWLYRNCRSYGIVNLFFGKDSPDGSLTTSATEPSVQLDIMFRNISADGPQTARLVVKPFQTVAEEIFIQAVGPKCTVNLPLNFTLEIHLLTYLLTSDHTQCGDHSGVFVKNHLLPDAVSTENAAVGATNASNRPMFLQPRKYDLTCCLTSNIVVWQILLVVRGSNCS